MSSSTSNVSTAQNSRSSIQLDGKTKSTTDHRALQLLEDHQPWEMLDNTVLAIIDQTYAALLEILGIAALPEGGGPIKAWKLVDATDDPDSPASPMLCVVEASARHCCVRLIDGFDAGGIGASWPWEPELMRYISFSQTRRQLQKRRTSVSTSSGTVRLARITDGGGGGGGGEGEAGQGGHGWKCTDDDDDRPDVSEKGLVGVLDTMRSHLDNAIQLETIVIRMASRSGCYDKLRESFKVRMALEGMRRQVDLGAVMRRCRDRGLRRAREIGRRRPAEEMDVDQVDEAEVLTKRLKAMHV